MKPGVTSLLTSFVLIVIVKATAEMVTMATNRPFREPGFHLSERRRQFVSLAKNIDSPSRHSDPFASVSHIWHWLSLTWSALFYALPAVQFPFLGFCASSRRQVKWMFLVEWICQSRQPIAGCCLLFTVVFSPVMHWCQEWTLSIYCGWEQREYRRK